jgi:CheY-like chemotaxis protein
LATAYGIVQQHRGWIEVESHPGVGTTFHIYLPRLANRLPIKSEQRDISHSHSGQETILVVEDEESLRHLVRDYLGRHGYLILEAASGRAALEIWGEHWQQIDLLLTDMVMPEGMTGRELGEKLLERKPELKIIYTSGYSPETIEREFFLHEGINFLQKPYAPRELIQVVRECLDKKDYESS